MKRVKKFFTNILRQQSGAAALEFALVSVPLIIVTFLIIETGRYVYLKQALVSAVDKATRTLYIDGNTTVGTMRTIVIEGIVWGNADSLNLTVSPVVVDGVPAFRIDAAYQFNTLIPNILPDPISITDQQILLTQ